MVARSLTPLWNKTFYQSWPLLSAAYSWSRSTGTGPRPGQVAKPSHGTLVTHTSGAVSSFQSPSCFRIVGGNTENSTDSDSFKPNQSTLIQLSFNSTSASKGVQGAYKVALKCNKKGDSDVISLHHSPFLCILVILDLKNCLDSRLWMKNAHRPGTIAENMFLKILPTLNLVLLELEVKYLEKQMP